MGFIPLALVQNVLMDYSRRGQQGSHSLNILHAQLAHPLETIQSSIGLGSLLATEVCTQKASVLVHRPGKLLQPLELFSDFMLFHSFHLFYGVKAGI